MKISLSSQYTEDYLLLSFYSQHCYGEWSIFVLFLFTWFFRKIYIMYHCIMKYNDILIFVIFQIKISSIIIFSQIWICAFLVFLVTILKALKYFHNFSLSTETPFIWYLLVIRKEKNTCQCLSTIKVQLHSSFILPKNYQFVITLSTSQHKDRRPFRKPSVSLLFFGEAE